MGLRRMQFVLEGVSEHGGRMGRIIWSSTSQTTHEACTPLCMPYTRAGAVPHLTPDILEDIYKVSSKTESNLALLSLPTLYEVPGAAVLQQYQGGIHDFLNMKDHFIYLSVQDPHAPPKQGFNEDKNVSIWCRGGRNKITVSDHLKLVEAFRPNVFEALCDSVSSDGNKLKRMKKSVNRTLKFLDDTIALRSTSKVLTECSLLGAIEGSDILEERKRSAIETAKRPVDGFVLEGFDLNHKSESMREVLTSTIELLPSDKPKFIHGLHTPGDIFTAVESGIDVFDGSFPYTASERGAALVFNNRLSGNDQLHSDGVTGQGDEGVVDRYSEINLEDERYAMDFKPLLCGCTCYACTNHTRAYIHHLLNTKEILAKVLLMTHNMSHYLMFFSSLRESLKSSMYCSFKKTCTQGRCHDNHSKSSVVDS